MEPSSLSTLFSRFLSAGPSVTAPEAPAASQATTTDTLRGGSPAPAADAPRCGPGPHKTPPVGNSDSTPGSRPRPVNFTPSVCTVDLGLWRALGATKLTRWRLETPVVSVTGTLLPLHRHVRPHHNENAVDANDKGRTTSGSNHVRNCWRLHLDNTAGFQSGGSAANHRSLAPDVEVLASSGLTDATCPEGPNVLNPGNAAEHSCDFQVEGDLLNVNSAADFRLIDRKQLIRQTIAPLLDLLRDAKAQLPYPYGTTKSNSITLDQFFSLPIPRLLQCTSSSNNAFSLCSRFLLLCYADLKNHLYYYNVAIPTLALPGTQCFSVFHPPQPASAFFSPKSLTAISNGLFLSSSGSTPSGLRGICVFVRRKRIPDTLPSTPPNAAPSPAAQTVSWAQYRHWWQWCDSLLSTTSYGVPHCPISVGSVLPVPEDDACVIQLSTFLAVYSAYRPSETDAGGDSPPTHIPGRTPASLLQSPVFESPHSGPSTIDAVLCCPDPTSTASNSSRICRLGWPLRSVLTCLGHLGLSDGILPLLLFRGAGCSTPDAIWLAVSMPIFGDTRQALPSPLPILDGWLRHTAPPVTGTRVPAPASSVTFRVDLRRHLDPVAVQKSAVSLNVQLIQWRILPSFDLLRLRKLRFLLIGMGTLGCALARDLVSWGVTDLSFIDNGRVSLSSPTRQTLYTYKDALWDRGRGRLKVFAAKKRLLQVRPDLSLRAFPLEVPMPGHPRFLVTETGVPLTNAERRVAPFLHTVRLLEHLIDMHDVILLLTDSRESRWLPALLVATRHRNLRAPAWTYHAGEGLSPPSVFPTPPVYRIPLCITVALGFDSFLVMRQGRVTQTSSSSSSSSFSSSVTAKSEEPFPTSDPAGETHLACYFCNDLAAPADSMTRRPLDEQCTVTRPGVSGLAASVATELIAAISQHPDAPSPPPVTTTPSRQSCLGCVPHTLRGFLMNFQLIKTHTDAFKHCVCCSSSICEAYCSDAQFLFLDAALRHSQTLEHISGLAELKERWQHRDVVLPLDDATQDDLGAPVGADSDPEESDVQKQQPL